MKTLALLAIGWFLGYHSGRQAEHEAIFGPPDEDVEDLAAEVAPLQ